MATPARPQLTVDALDALDEDVRAEVVDGELVIEAMTSFAHSDTQSSIVSEIKHRFGGGGPGPGEGWWIGTEVTVIYGSTQGFRHDVAGGRKARVPERPTGSKIAIRPDWVCEVLSTNKRKDLVEKRRVLHESGVPHYWIADPDERLLTVLRHHPDAYLLVTTVGPTGRARLEPFDSVELEVARLFGDLE